MPDLALCRIIRQLKVDTRTCADGVRERSAEPCEMKCTSVFNNLTGMDCFAPKLGFRFLKKAVEED